MLNYLEKNSNEAYKFTEKKAYQHISEVQNLEEKFVNQMKLIRENFFLASKFSVIFK